jgi:hypothetical protein
LGEHADGARGKPAVDEKSYHPLKTYLAVVTSFKVWSLVIRSSIPDTNFGARLFTICRMPGSNSWRMLMPVSLPIVEPKVLKVPEVERVRYGR